MGDAICGFNPVYAQGMTGAAMEATVLDDCMCKGVERLAQRFFTGAATFIYTPWRMAVGADLRFREVPGQCGLMTRFINWYTRRLQQGAQLDPSAH